MMSIDFFIAKCQTENINETEFGICDDNTEQGKMYAYVDTEQPDKWVAIVKNETGKAINFTSIDNCVEIKREDGTMDFRCDAMLTSVEHIVFVELKEQMANWISHAVDEQLQTTIDHFKSNHDISKYKYKRAFVCNKKHPHFRVSYKDKMASFYQKNNVRLSLVREIVL